MSIGNNMMLMQVKLEKFNHFFFFLDNPKDEKEAAIHAFLFRGNFIRKFMR